MAYAKYVFPVERSLFSSYWPESSSHFLIVEITFTLFLVPRLQPLPRIRYQLEISTTILPNLRKICMKFPWTIIYQVDE